MYDDCQKKGRIAAALWISALACLEAWVGFADHEDLATPTHNLTVTVTGLCRFEGGKNLHEGALLRGIKIELNIIASNRS